MAKVSKTIKKEFEIEFINKTTNPGFSDNLLAVFIVKDPQGDNVKDIKIKPPFRRIELPRNKNQDGEEKNINIIKEKIVLEIPNTVKNGEYFLFITIVPIEEVGSFALKKFYKKHFNGLATYIDKKKSIQIKFNVEQPLGEQTPLEKTNQLKEEVSDIKSLEEKIFERSHKLYWEIDSLENQFESLDEISKKIVEFKSELEEMKLIQGGKIEVYKFIKQEVIDKFKALIDTIKEKLEALLKSKKELTDVANELEQEKAEFHDLLFKFMTRIHNVYDSTQDDAIKNALKELIVDVESLIRSYFNIEESIRNSKYNLTKMEKKIGDLPEILTNVEKEIKQGKEINGEKIVQQAIIDIMKFATAVEQEKEDMKSLISSLSNAYKSLIPLKQGLEELANYV